jgi:hypothetical protein
VSLSRPQRVFADNRAECRLCGAHVRINYRNAKSAAAWCSVCCTTSVYNLAPTHTVA